jgi:hypothetical protein
MTSQSSPAPAVFHNRIENYDIMETIEKIQKQRGLYKQEELKLMYKEFSDDNPELFRKCVTTQMSTDDMLKMKYLLNLRQQVKDGKLPFDKASGMLSVKMAQEYQPELLQKDGFTKKKKK